MQTWRWKLQVTALADWILNINDIITLLYNSSQSYNSFCILGSHRDGGSATLHWLIFIVVQFAKSANSCVLNFGHLEITVTLQ